MKKPKSSHIERKIDEYQQRLTKVLSNIGDTHKRMALISQEIYEMKQALFRRDQELDSWRDLLADMQIEIGQLRAGTSAGTNARTPDPATPEPSNGFNWWRRVFATEPAPARATLEDALRHELLHILSQEPHLRNLRR